MTWSNRHSGTHGIQNQHKPCGIEGVGEGSDKQVRYAVSNYSKIKKGERETSIEALDKIAKLFGMTMDEVIHFEGKVPKEVRIKDKTVSEKLQLIEQLEDEDNQAIFRIIEGMLTKTKFKDFFQKNEAAL